MTVNCSQKLCFDKDVMAITAVIFGFIVCVLYVLYNMGVFTKKLKLRETDSFGGSEKLKKGKLVLTDIPAQQDFNVPEKTIKTDEEESDFEEEEYQKGLGLPSRFSAIDPEEVVERNPDAEEEEKQEEE